MARHSRPTAHLSAERTDRLSERTGLAAHRGNVYSQWGEDGVIEKAFEVVGAANRWCVELGAWDGKLHSNTHRLIGDCGWSGVLIEADPKRFRELQSTYADEDRAICVRRTVGVRTGETLDEILAATPIPRDFDLLSIDIDGNDYHVWASVHAYEPRIVVIEFNQTIPLNIAFTQPLDPGVSQGSSLRAMVELGRSKEYELIATTDANAFFVRAELYPRFGIVDNSPDALYHDRQYISQVFQLFDGTIVWTGCDRLLWDDLPIEPERLQILPKRLRFRPAPTQSLLRRAIRSAYVRYRRRRANPRAF